MKILIVHNSLNDGMSMSGVLKHYLLMARAWVKSGHQVDFMLAKAGFPQLKSQAPECGIVCSDPFFDASQYISQTWRYFPAFGFRMLSAHWATLPQNYQIVYASNFLIFELYPARCLARRCGARLVVKVQHLLHSQSQRHTLFDRLFLASEKWSMHLAHRYADLIMCLSRPVEQDFKHLAASMGLPERQAFIVGCGLDFSELEKVPELPPAFDLVFLGRMHEQKGIFDLPDVWKAVLDHNPSARMVVIGEGPHRRRLQELMAERGLSRGITFTGGISESEKNRYLKQSKVGLSLSFEEGWGLSVTECLASGLPVVAYELPVFQDVFHGILHLVPPRCARSAAESVIKLLDDPGLATVVGECGRKHVRNFDYQRVAQRELELMRSSQEAPRMQGFQGRERV
ncbi:MAG: glycosyltransferase family 4 protein [Verrucomicrobiota bacterium]|nr:glycosyltransferase family 4 protein [Verrucomicrobiota bacterium]